jgi:hypothetical protein
MGLNPSPPTVAGSITLIVVFILTIPTFLNILGDVRSKFRAKECDDGHRTYEDEDGAATEESQKEHSNAIPKYFTLASSVIGFLASATTAVITSVTSTNAIYLNNWLLFGSWVDKRPSNYKGLLTADQSTVPIAYRNGIHDCGPRLQEDIHLWQIECNSLHCNICGSLRPIRCYSLVQ